MLTTRTNNRTSVHTLHFLTGWYVGDVLVTNPYYVRPSATAKGQTGDVRTPFSDLPPRTCTEFCAEHLSLSGAKCGQHGK